MAPRTRSPADWLNASCLIPSDFDAGRINVVSNGDQEDVIIDSGFKNGLYVVSRDRWKNRTEQNRTEQNRSLFRCDLRQSISEPARPSGHACWPYRPCGAPFCQDCDFLFGFPEHRSRQLRQYPLVSGGLVQCAQKPMSPTKRGGDRKIAALCRLPNRRPISEAVSIGEPPALLVKAL